MLEATACGLDDANFRVLGLEVVCTDLYMKREAPVRPHLRREPGWEHVP
jgi:hypothetical protein